MYVFLIGFDFFFFFFLRCQRVVMYVGQRSLDDKGETAVFTEVEYLVDILLF